MSDSFLILTPLLALVVVLFLGFAGCDIVFDLDPVEVKPLNFEAQVVIPLTVVGGVTFTYLRPGQTMPDTRTANAQGNNVFALSFDERDNGSWMVNCQMTVELGGVQEHKVSTTVNFMMPDSGNWVITFVASGTPLDDFDIKPGALEQI